ncbi:recombinase [Proteus penneri]|uniref:recombinase n=1 Tax=Proteus penneri TaxID=102862 RepID=UPI002246451C|nr:recombinase [Proteus penneri]MCX2589124.1 recombinase [Proteus penneri]
MNKHTELSDFEINKNVFIKLYGEESLKDKDMFNSFYRTDYCHNPEDAMPIIIENEISMIKSSGGWMCCHGSVGNVEHESLYRGAMEVFLMMKDAENEKV